MQIQTSTVSANHDLAPATNSPLRQKNWNNTIANITGLTTGLTVYTIGTAIIISSALQRSDWLCGGYIHCEDAVMQFLLGNAVLSLTIGICARRVTKLALLGLQTSSQIENKISPEQKA